MAGLSRAACADLDRADPLAAWRGRFAIPERVVYLDGNSLGARPAGAAAAVARVIEQEWGRGLIRSWNEAAWIEAPARIGDKIGRLIGAAPGQVIACDSTSVNLHKLLNAGLDLRPGRRVILTEERNFPTDQYIAAGVARTRGAEFRRVPRAELEGSLGPEVALLALTHVDYVSGEVHDLPRLTGAAHAAGALALWDLSHSAGAVTVDLDAAGADLAVGCGYKYLNGGPGAPAYLYVAQALQGAAENPVPGWMGHADPFAFASEYAPAAGVGRFMAGTPAIVALASLEVAVDLWLECGVAPAAAKSRALTDLFIALVDERLAGRDVEVASPRASEHRGAQVSLRCEPGYGVMRALIDRGVIGDFRPPDLLRFGFPGLYTRFADVWDAVDAIRDVLDSGSWQEPRFAERLPVT